MLTTPIRRIAFTLSAVALTTFSLAAQDAPLRYQWTKGEKVKYLFSQDTNAAMSGVPGLGDMTVTTVMQQMQTFTTMDVAPDGAATLSVKFESVKMDMGTPMGQVSFDSTSPNPPSDPIGQQIAPMFNAVVGESVTLVMEPNGNLRSLTGATAIRDKMTKAMPNSAGMMTLGPGSGLDSLFSDEAMKGTFSQGIPLLPKTAVKPGATWPGELKITGAAGVMTAVYAFTFKGVETLEGRSVARIAYTQKLKADGTTTQGPMVVKMQDASGDGEVLFDVKLGRLVKSTSNATMPMSMTMTTPDGQSISLQALTKMKATLELLK